MENTPRATATKRQKAAPKSQAILVLGMHRSGTSALTRVLNLLGCALPSELVEPNDSNETGHWESAEAVALNDRILESAGSRWDDWGPINSDWRQSSARDDMIAEVGDLLTGHTKLGRLFALKDPRLCRIADVWLDAMQTAQITPLITMIIRNPDEVAQSLESRDLMARGYGQLLWLRHVLDAEHLSRGQRRVVVTYDQLMTNWYDVADKIKTGLGVAFPRNSPAVHLEIDAFLSPQHRHHQQPVDKVTKNPSLSDWLRRTLAILLAWSEDGEKVNDHAELDAIRLEFDRSYSAFARLLIQGNAAGEVGSGLYLKQQLSQQIAEAQQASAAAQSSIREAEERLAAQTARETQLAAELAAEVARAKEAQAELTRWREHAKHIEFVEGQTETLRKAEAALTAEVTRLQNTLADAETKVATLEGELGKLAAEQDSLSALAAEAERLRAAEAALVTQRDALEATLNASDSTIASLQAEVARLSGENGALAILESEATSLRSAKDALDGQLVEAQDALAVAQAELVQREADAAKLRQRAAELDAQVASLNKAIVDAQARLTDTEAKLAETEARAAGEKERRQEAELQLTKQGFELDQEKWKASEYQAQLASAKSALIQREEELAQVWKQVLEAEKSAAIANTTVTQEIARREASEQALTDLRDQTEAARAQQSQALEKLSAEVAMTTRLLRDENAASTAAHKALATAEADLAARNDDLARTIDQLREAEAVREQLERKLVLAQNRLEQAERRPLNTAELADALEKLRAAEAAREEAERKLLLTESRLEQAERKPVDTAELKDALDKLHTVETQLIQAERKQTESTREIAVLADKLLRSERDAETANSARVAAERKLASRFDEIARLTSLLSDEAGVASASRADAEWLREIAKVSRGFPKWWALMPASWRRAKEHARYARRGLFDAAQYIANNPDVARENIDPLLHYIVHGSLEGRTWR
jgi:hypothetical protein